MPDWAYDWSIINRGYAMETTEGKILREARHRLGLTQQEVADKARIQIRQYQKFEGGERKLSTSSFYIARKVLEVLQLDVTTFVREKNA